MYYGHVSTASNRADWQEACVLTDQETGELIDISQCRVMMTVTRAAPRSTVSSSYAEEYNSGPALTGSTDDGTITLPDVGTFEWLFSATRMAGLCQGEYVIGVRISQDDRTAQLIIGTVSVVEGIDNQ